MSFHATQRHWERFARRDPMWAILTQPGKENRAWDEAEFFRTGEAQIYGMMPWVQVVLPLARFDRALDFGCGMGRLTQPLAAFSKHVTGVDVAPTMIELASRHPNRPGNCDFVCNPRADLSLFEDATFDFVHSSITLQHIRPQYIRLYLREFARILKPGGALLFQLPTTPEEEIGALRRLGLRAAGLAMEALRKPIMEMHGIPEDEVRKLLMESGMAIVALRDSDAGGPGWEGYEYLAVKTQSRQMTQPASRK